MSDLPVAAPMDDPAFLALKDRVIQRTGHAYYEDKDSAFWERIRRRIAATETGTCARYLKLLDGAGTKADAEWSALESEVTIGETFFFRYLDQFDALRQTILPDIIERNRQTRRIRIWSAGCATGAEPYSVAIVLRELMGPEIDNWSIRIVATDINDAFLKAARAGLYGNWAMRTLTPAERERYFIPDEHSGRLLIRPEFRGMVMFQRHNLLDLLDGPSAMQFSDFDLIMCRNVLIYFRLEAAARIMGELGERLCRRGWLLVGTAEPSPIFSGVLQHVALPGTAAYRRVEPPAPHAEDGAAVPPQPETPIYRQARRAVLEKPPLRLRALRRRRTETLPTVPNLRLAPVGSDLPAALSSASERSKEDLIGRIRMLAGRGELEEARQSCLQATKEDPSNPIIYFYDGLIAHAMADDGAAERAFRKSLYLNKQFIMAHYQLGLLLMRSGDQATARRYLQNAVQISRELPDDELLPEGGGLSAADLRAGAALHLEYGDRRPAGIMSKT